MRVSPVPIARTVGAVYVNWIRNTPLTLVMFFFAFCVPLLLPGRTNFLVLAIWALGIYTATYVAETIRSGINTVPVGQAEAARAIGLTFGQVMSLVVLPQACAIGHPADDERVHRAPEEHHGRGRLLRSSTSGNIRAEMSEKGENQLVTILWVMLSVRRSWCFCSPGVQRLLENKWRIAR